MSLGKSKSLLSMMMRVVIMMMRVVIMMMRAAIVYLNYYSPT
jgi:hypothetical protein